ncbi:MAG: glycosyltransferase [Candidatus Moranbacteria bacterium]|nr:glycosyltransferase [Candidatus Moranbacteria bacterium]
MKVALVHDYLVQYGGAERVLEVLCKMFPDAPIYTLINDPKAVHHRFDSRRIHTSTLQKTPLARTRHRLFPSIMASAIEEFDLSLFDIVISDSSSFAKGVITRPETLHICYAHTPMRYAWDDCQRYAKDFGFPSAVRSLVPLFMNPLRLWDRTSAMRVDHFIANSQFVKKRIEKYYRRTAQVIHPPVDTSRFHPTKKQEAYFLMVGRLIPYKRFDLAIRVCNRLGIPLKIIGRGSEMKRLKKIAGPTITFLGRVPDKELPDYYAKCQAFIFPQEEDFGIVATEAMASGRPVIAFAGGDIPERVIHGETGILFQEQSVISLEKAIKEYQRTSFDSEKIYARAQKYQKERFVEEMQRAIERQWQKHQENQKNSDIVCSEQ